MPPIEKNVGLGAFFLYNILAVCKKVLNLLCKRIVKNTKDQKMANLSEAARAAKDIRKELKAAFPGCKFRVTSKIFAGGDSVRIEWTNGPTTKAVREITDKYQGGSFDGMTDMYTYNRSNEVENTAKYVHVTRDISEQAKAIKFQELKEKMAGWEELTHWDQLAPHGEYASAVIRREFTDHTFIHEGTYLN